MKLRTILALSAIALVAVPSAAAHGTEPRLEISSERISRGAPLTVGGYDFAYEDVVELTLIGADEDWRIGSATADVEGSFTHTVVLPEAMREGDYVVGARTQHHRVESTPLLVTGLATAPDDSGRRDQSDALAPSAASGPGVAASADVVRVEHATGRDLTPLLAIVLTVLLLGGAVALRRAQSRRSTAS